MNDLYLKLATSSVGKNIFQALNLPKPVSLTRSPDEVLSLPSGRVLIAGTKNNFAFKMITKFLDVESINLLIIKATNELFKISKPIINNIPEEIDLNNLGSKRFKYIVFDATGFKKPEDLQALYVFFHPIMRKFKSNSKIVIVGQSSKSISCPIQSATNSALVGFVKSIAKELGRNGTTCNLLLLEKGAERELQIALYYFLSEKSAFITGQSLELEQSSVKQKKINWQAPLKDKVAIVTGAAQGIGRETAKVLARDGACVVCLDIPANKSSLKKLAKEIGGHSLALDLNEKDAAEQILNTIRSQLGVVDIVVHNAGVTRDKTLANMPEHFWDQVININLAAVTNITQLLLENQALSPKARIVCISSISGIAGNFGQTNYACSKSGIIGYVKSMAKISNDKFTINAIAPGFIETKMTGQIPFMTRELGRRMNTLSQGGLPLDIAEGVSLFCHPASQALNGNVLRVCGQSILGA